MSEAVAEQAVTRVEPTPVANPAALGLGAFALTTFLLSAYNAGWAPNFVWIGTAFFYGGLVQLLAGMWEFRNRNTFGCVAFSTYGGFWLSLGFFVVMILTGLAPENIEVEGLGWFLLAFAIFNTYMLFWSTLVNKAVFLVFLTLEATEIILVLGFLAGDVTWLIRLGGYVGVLTALVAWYTSAAIVANNTAGRSVLPEGKPLWTAG